ncbi:type II toxin-antitoxin system HicA family toxin [Candidatus Poribacteria bacterium]|nr:MAG: type II toxin-antitoxin system HicA family toxin [Candidatus Poribacteria bacterium]
MNRKHERTLNAIFRTPVPKTLEWRKIESLLIACGVKTIEGRGSRVRFELNGVTATFHRPHNRKETLPYQVKDVRQFLEEAGIIP